MRTRSLLKPWLTFGCVCPNGEHWRLIPDPKGLSMHAATYNTFNVCRHLTTARTHRLFRAEALSTWREAAGLAG